MISQTRFPLKTLESNIQEMENFLLVQNELNEIVSEIVKNYESKPNTSIHNTIFNLMISNWGIYRKAKADYDSIDYLGKANYNQFYSKSMIQTTKEKIVYLQNLYLNLV